MTREIYYLLENIALTGTDKDAFFDLNELEGASNDSPNPRQRNHAENHLRNDGEAQIYQGDFPDLTPGHMVSLLAQVIDGQLRFQAVPNNVYGDEFNLQLREGASWNTQCRMIIFGGVSATLEESHEAVQQYLKDNAVDWSPVKEEGGEILSKAGERWWKALWRRLWAR